MFCQMFLPFMRPVWSGLIRRLKTFSNLSVIAFDVILLSMSNNVIGCQLASVERSESSLGINVITPLRCEGGISPALYKALKLSTRS